MYKSGISIYPDKTPRDEVYIYLEKAAQLGCSRIFTCFLSIPEDRRETYLVEFKEFMDKAHELGSEAAANTNPEVFTLTGATPDNLKSSYSLGLDITRTNGNLRTQRDTQLTHNPYGIKIELNTSMDMGVELLINKGGNKDQITMYHNFFPERYTGTDFNLLAEYNSYWEELNLHAAVFVSSNNENTIGPW